MIAQPASRIRVFALATMLLGIVAACGSHPQYERVSQPPQRVVVKPAATPRMSRAGVGERAAIVALQQIGVPYRYGGTTRSGFDCSGLVQFSYARVGKNVARTTGQLWSTTTAVGRHELQVGDLLFFRFDGKMSHVGLYIGGQEFVHAPSSGHTVVVASLASPVYAKAFLRAGRPK